MSHPIEKMLRDMLAKTLPIPRFRFDPELYNELVREGEDGEKVVEGRRNPKIKFEHGPVDGVLGMYNPKTDTITIDVLEHLLVVLKGKHFSMADLKQKFDDRLTRTLAHEGGHWQLQKRKGWWPTVEKLAINFVILFIGLFAGWNCFHLFNTVVFKKLWPAVSSGGEPLLGILGIAAMVAVYAWIILKGIPGYIHVWMAISAMVTYRICWHERYARDFEERPEEDERWEDVVVIEDGFDKPKI